MGGGYQAVECEGEVGRNVVNAGDDFTVETALEDLEFGFSITTSKQKVSTHVSPKKKEKLGSAKKQLLSGPQGIWMLPKET